jgi:hypothetical protein
MKRLKDVSRPAKISIYGYMPKRSHIAFDLAGRLANGETRVKSIPGTKTCPGSKTSTRSYNIQNEG